MSEAERSEADANFFKSFADTLAEMVQKELAERKILLLISNEKEISAFRYIGSNPVGTNDVYQASLLTQWPAGAMEMPAKDFLYKHVRRWAIEMGLKLARPACLTTYEMELPKGVNHAAVGRSPDLVLRCIVNYYLPEDMMVLRVDALAKWDE